MEILTFALPKTLKELERDIKSAVKDGFKFYHIRILDKKTQIVVCSKTHLSATEAYKLYKSTF